MQNTQEMPVWSLGWEDPLEEEMATQYSSLFVWKVFQYSCMKNHMDREAWRAVSPKGHKESDTLSDQVHPSGGKRDLNSH